MDKSVIKEILAKEGYPDFMIESTMEYKMKPIGAFITLDWLYREPDQAKKALKRGIK